MKQSKGKLQVFCFLVITSIIVAQASCSNMLHEYDDELSLLGSFGSSLNNVGATDSIRLRTLGFEPDDTNAIFVSKAGSDVVTCGTEVEPCLTINYAKDRCDIDHQSVVILDSGIYDEPGIIMEDNFIGLYAALGQTPVFRPQEASYLRDLADVTPPAPITGTDDYIYSMDVARLNNGNWVFCYSDYNDSQQGKFVIYNQQGQLVFGPVTFETGRTGNVSIAVLTSGKWVITYELGNDWFGNFVMYNQDGTLSRGRTQFEPGSSFSISAAGLQNGNFVICYQANDIDATHGRFRIFNDAGVQQGGTAVFGNGGANAAYFSVAVLNNGNFVVCYGGANGNSYGTYCIFTQTGAAVAGPTIFDSSSAAGYCSVSALSNGDWVCCYRSSYPRYVIYNSGGGQVVGPTNFSSGSVGGISSVAFSGEWAVNFIDNSDGATGKTIIYSNSGAEQMSSTYFSSRRVSRVSTALLANGTIVSCYSDQPAGNRGMFKILYPDAWTGIKVSTDAVINGLIIDANIRVGLARTIHLNNRLATLTFQYCDILNSRSPVPSLDALNGCGVYGNGAVTVDNSKIYGNDCGVFIEANMAAVTDSHIYWNNNGYGIYINGAAANPQEITVNHADIFSNQDGLRLQNNNGANEEVKNSIIHLNDGNGICSDEAITLSYSLCNDPLINAVAGPEVYDLDPLYINDGVMDPLVLDLHLRGGSPAIGLADDDLNAGAYNIR